MTAVASIRERFWQPALGTLGAVHAGVATTVDAIGGLSDRLEALEKGRGRS